MLINLGEYDLIKAITRKEATAVHKDLPPGGAWKTIRGHHVYIKDGKVLAGSIPGATKAKKATKAQLAEHQATIDKDAKKGTKTGDKANAKAKTTKANAKPKTQRSGVTGTDKKKTAGTTSKGAKPKKGEVTNEVPKSTKKTVSGVSSGSKPKSAPKSTGAKTTAKPSTKKSGAKETSKKQIDHNEKTLRNLASQADDGMDLWALASEDPKAMQALKEALKTAEGSSMKEKLDYLHKKYGGSEADEYKKANPKGITDFKLGKPKFKPSDVKMSVSESHRAEASADMEGKVIFRSDILKHPMETQKHVMIHEIGHVISNAYPNLEKHIMSNPQDGLGRTNVKAGRFEGVSYTPEESWAESFARYHTEPKVFKQKYPTQYNFVDQVLKKIPNYKEYVDKGLEELNRMNGITTKGATKDEKPTTASKTAKSKGTGKSVPGTKKATSEGGNSNKKTKGVKDVRSEAQKNRELAYDVGEKVGGARKDDFVKNFKEKPTMQNLEAMEGMGGAIAQKNVTKANLLPPMDLQKEKDDGVDLHTALMKKLIFDRIAPKPVGDTPEDRKAYMNSINKLHRHFAGVKNWEQMKNAVREFSDLGYKQKDLDQARYMLSGKSGASYVNEDYYKKKVEAGEEAKKQMDFSPLGSKLEAFFSDWSSRENTMRTVNKNAGGGWDKYMESQKKEKVTTGGKAVGGENKKWQRKAEAEHLRTGGKETKVSKPEELVKQFGLRGVEFGHWVNDSSGLYHLKRCAESFDDLAGVLGVDNKDISLNGRLAIAFGARGSGNALAHYEPDRKVINMTKYGGAGSLAHEWGHAMDNILYQYSKGGADSLGLASEGGMGNADPKLKALYDNLIDSIRKPAPGEIGATKKVSVDSEAKKLGNYYPIIRNHMKEHGVEEGTKKSLQWMNDRLAIRRNEVKSVEYALSQVVSDPSRKKYWEKRLKKVQRDLNSFEREIPHQIAKEIANVTGKPYKGEIHIPTENSEYYQRMLSTDGDRKAYYATNAEMFARVFESYVQHKLDAKKQYNNYLVHGTREGNVKVEGAPFPLGKERDHMFKAMDNLMAHVSKGGALKKALILEILASGRGDMTEELRKSIDYDERLRRLKERRTELTTDIVPKRSAYNIANPEEVIYIPLNRLRTPYQTEKATNWDKVDENLERMQNGENLEPVSIGLDYDIHDGHHRYEASKKAGHEHIPCIVKGGNELERQRAIEAYKEVWKAIVTDPVAPDAFEEDSEYVYRGIGQRELDYIRANGHIQTKGKGNDEDKDRATCFSNLYRQAVGYARSNYDLYNEKRAYVVALPKVNIPWIEEDETGELISREPVMINGMQIIAIPKPDIVKSFETLIKSFDESKHPRDSAGKFTTGQRSKMVEAVKSSKAVDPGRKLIKLKKLPKNETEKNLIEAMDNVVEELRKKHTDKADFNKEEAEHVIRNLKRMGFQRDKVRDLGSGYQTACYTVEYRVNPKKAIILSAHVGKLGNATAVYTGYARYKDEADFDPSIKKEKTSGYGNLWGR